MTHEPIQNLSDLTPDPANANRGTPRGRQQLEQSLRKFGAGRSILLDNANRIVAGNKTVETAAALGIEKVRVIETDGSEIIAVKRTDVDLSTKEGREFAIADNRTGQTGLSWDPAVLATLAVEGVDLSDWFFQEELEQFHIEPVAATVTAPEEFPEYDEEIETEHCCPKCGYKWSGGK